MFATWDDQSKFHIYHIFDLSSVFLHPGACVELECERPTIANTTYPIRRVDISQDNFGRAMYRIFCGLGSTPADEALGRTIRGLH